MKKTEAISILATSVRPREAKDRARYDEAVKMAIEALRCSEIPNSSDSISRRAAIDAFRKEYGGIKNANMDGDFLADEIEFVLSKLPSARPEQPPYVAEIEAEYQKAVKMPHIHKPLAKALYEVWEKHDREDAERREE